MFICAISWLWAGTIKKKTQKPTSPINIEKNPQGKDFELQPTNKNFKSHHHWTRSRKHLQEHQDNRKNSSRNKELNQAKGKSEKDILHQSHWSQSQQTSTTITITTNHASLMPKEVLVALPSCLTPKDGFSGITFLPDA